MGSYLLMLLESAVAQLASIGLVDSLWAAVAILTEQKGPFGIDTSIEGMKSQQFSVGIFYFLVVAIIVFTIFVFMFMLKGKGEDKSETAGKGSGLKSGEKLLFIWLLLGIVVAIGFGAAQMLHGYLF